MTLHHELTGSGPTVVLVHEGIADSRMWDPQWTSFAEGYRLVRLDLAGFGGSPIERLPLTNARDVIGLLDGLGIADAALVGASMGGRVVLEVAVARPDLARALVLVDSGLPGVGWSEAVRAYQRAEEEAAGRGDLDAAVEANLRMWIDGPNRAPGDVDPDVRRAVAQMLHHAFELQLPHLADLDEELLVPDVAGRLGEIRAPALVLVGSEDVEDMQAIARKLAAEIPAARLETIAGAAHMPSLERPAVFDELVLGFLAEVL